VHFICTEIPQQMVDALETRHEVITVLKINRRQGFARVRVYERQ